MLLTDLEFARLAAEGLARDVMPELTSHNARATAGMCIQALRELMHRDTVLPGIIAALAPQGLALVEQSAALLGRCGIAIPAGSPSADALTSKAALFSLIVKQLDDRAKALLGATQSSAELAADIGQWLRAVAEWESSYYSAFQELPMPTVGDTDISGRPLTPEKLAAHMRQRFPEMKDIRIDEFRNIPGGMSNETYFFTLSTADGERQELVIRKKALSPFFDFWANQASNEFEIVSTLAQQGLAVAKPLWLFENMPDLGSSYYVMQKGRGQTIGNHEAAFGAGAKFSERLMLNLAEFLAKLHSVPLEAFSGYLSTGDTTAEVGDTVSDVVRKNVDFLHSYWLTSRRRPCPSEAFMLDWLRRNVPKNSRRPSMVHTDCFVHNLLVGDDDEITTVVDWESAHFGDPAEDLAYVKDMVSQSIDWSRFMAHYRACGGPEVNEDDFHYYKAMLNFRNSWGTNIAVTRVDNGFFDIRMAVLGSQYFTTWMKTNVDATAT